MELFHGAIESGISGAGAAPGGVPPTLRQPAMILLMGDVVLTIVPGILLPVVYFHQKMR